MAIKKYNPIGRARRMIEFREDVTAESWVPMQFSPGTKDEDVEKAARYGLANNEWWQARILEYTDGGEWRVIKTLTLTIVETGPGSVDA